MIEFHFLITFLNEEIEYSPLDCSINDNESLPEYLTQTICFEKQELPKFLNKLLSVVYKKI